MEAELLLLNSEFLKVTQEKAALLQTENFYYYVGYGVTAVFLVISLGVIVYSFSNTSITEHFLKSVENQLLVSSTEELSSLTELLNIVSNKSTEEALEVCVRVSRVENVLNNMFLFIEKLTKNKDHTFLSTSELITQNEIETFMLDVTNNLASLASNLN